MERSGSIYRIYQTILSFAEQRSVRGRIQPIAVKPSRSTILLTRCKQTQDRLVLIAVHFLEVTKLNPSASESKRDEPRVNKELRVLSLTAWKFEDKRAKKQPKSAKNHAA